MSRISDAIARASAVAQARRPTRSHPDGWEPGVRWDEATRTGGITISTNKPSPQWDALLAEWGFDPLLFEVANDTIQFRTWDANIGEGNVQRFYYYKAQIRAKRPEVDSDLASLIDEVRKRKPRTVAALEGDRSLVIALSDWQIGREGTEEATRRILRLVDEIPALWREYVKQGIRLTDIVILGLGDLIEGCTGWYPAQAFTIEFNAREQRTLARRLLVKVIEAALTVAPKVRVVVVGGNHGENRNSEGKPYTDSSDNGDVEIAEQAAEVFAANESFRDRVAFVVPRDELAITIDVHGTIVGLTHGHLGRSGANSTAKVETWWKGQALGMKPIADATVLITAHYHHLALMTHGPRTHIQAPAMCGRSAWFDDVTGVGDSPAGTLTLVVGGGRWDRLRLIAG